MRTCGGLPAPGQHRESLRRGVSLSVFMRKMIDGREQEQEQDSVAHMEQ